MVCLSSDRTVIVDEVTAEPVRDIDFTDHEPATPEEIRINAAIFLIQPEECCKEVLPFRWNGRDNADH